MAWLLDQNDRSILVFQPQQQPELRNNRDALIGLEGIPLTLTVEQVFGWLKMKK